jgi:hypothetical protein
MTVMQPSSGPSPEPGERRRLDHPPSDRYKTDATAAAVRPAAVDASPDATPSRNERLLRAAAVGLAGAITLTLLGGPLSITAGLVAAAGVIGWIVGLVARPGKAMAVVVAVASVALGLVGIWLYAGIEGGALGLLDYLAQVQGILVPAELGVAAVLAAAAG